MGKKTGTVNVQEIARAAAIEALKLQKDEERQRIRKNRFHNTELLLKNYLSMVEHFENAQDKASEEDLMETFSFEDMDKQDVIIQSIRRSKIRTKVMIRQIETCLDILRVKMIAKGQPEKYEVIQKLYLNPGMNMMSWTERNKLVADEIHCGETSVWKWRNEMIREMSILLFGVDGLQLEV
ncbi:MAG: hypothetical protein ACYCVD_02870 [Desulfitobacteriaceae bacterium]